MGRSKKLIVAGGGAAGIFCAVNAARLAPDLKVIVFEKSNRLLSKVAISGGGRCNLTHHCFSVAELIKFYPRGSRFLKKSFGHFGPSDTIEWFERRGLSIKAEADGRMFPVTDQSGDVIRCLLDEADRYQVEIRFNRAISGLTQSDSKFKVQLSDGTHETADFVCLAAGGQSILSRIDWIQQLGHHIIPPVPSLFTFNIPDSAAGNLMGLSVQDVIIKIAGTSFLQRGPLLFTHWGISGPAVLKLSAWAARDLNTMNYEFTSQINWIPEYHEQSCAELFLLKRSANPLRKLSNDCPFQLPTRFWIWLLDQSAISDAIRWTDLTVKQRNLLARNCCSFQFRVKGKTTFKEEFVTAGGIDLAEIDAHTMESKLIPHLFFAGEVMDVDGVTGGFNFQHAWTSGFLTAKSVAGRVT